jgi:hypothetical protein
MGMTHHKDESYVIKTLLFICLSGDHNQCCCSNHVVCPYICLGPHVSVSVCFCLLQNSSVYSVVISSMIIVACKVELIISSIIENFLLRCMCLYFLLYFCVLNASLHDSISHFSVVRKEPSTSN